MKLVRGERGGAEERLRELRRDTKSTVGIYPNSDTFSTSHTLLTPPSPLFHFCPPVATQARFSFRFSFPPTVPPLYRYRGPPSRWQTARGVVPFFFTTPPLSAHKSVARRCSRLVRLFFCFRFQVLTVPFSLIPLPFVSRRPRLILSPSPRRPIATRRPSSHRPHHVASVASPLSRRPLATRLPFATHRPSPRVALVASPSPRVALVALPPRHASPLRPASPLSRRPLATRHPRRAACRPVWKMEGK